ncbi:MAG: type I-E CRISPR-associated protein Cse1/CasA [Nitrospirae bacterium]|nr:type I-E CRISPR-associated protein Cse1/CasA [Nitrospirota bacterium]
MIQFNLIDEKWIPVRRHDGSEIMITPWEVTKEFADNPIVSLNAPRPDFNGALIQFLIGLVQTVAAPTNRIEWRQKLNDPPEPEELKAAFMTVHDAFELGGDGPRFMQDLEKLETEDRHIDGLLIDMPGNSTREKNTDHFIKRNTVTCICFSCCATALFAMQTNAPAGGAGFRTSLRGGGPLSTLIVGDERHNTLWHLLWLNVLQGDQFLRSCGNALRTAKADSFPWLAGTRTSESKTGTDTTPEDAYPTMVFWGMPRRIRLNLDSLNAGMCEICGKQSNLLVNRYQDKNYGMNFAGAWLHPLSPYSYNKDGLPLPIHAQPGGVSYRHWLGFVQEDSSNQRVPAFIVHEFRESRQQRDWQFRLWAFGYDMDNMKARCWYEAKMPLLQIETSLREDYKHYVSSMITAAVEISANVKSAVKKAWFRHPGDKNGDISFLDNIFWQNTESAFYEALHGLKTALESSNDAMENRKEWLDSLCREALKIFDFQAWEGPIEDADPKRVVIARSELAKFNRSNKIKALLDLPVEQKPNDTAAKKAHRRKTLR